jgi:hypothetical protein
VSTLAPSTHKIFVPFEIVSARAISGNTTSAQATAVATRIAPSLFNGLAPLT